MRTGVPCNENRFFPVRIYYTGKTLYWPCTRLQCMSLNLMSLNQDCTVFATHFLTKFRNQLLTNISDHKCNPVKSRCNLEYFSFFFFCQEQGFCASKFDLKTPSCSRCRGLAEKVKLEAAKLFFQHST